MVELSKQCRLIISKLDNRLYKSLKKSRGHFRLSRQLGLQGILGEDESQTRGFVWVYENGWQVRMFK